MSDSTPKSADADAGNARVRLWLDIRAPLERQLAPLGRAAIDRLRLAPGDRVLDIGPGIGGTPRALADIVGPEGRSPCVPGSARSGRCSANIPNIAAPQSPHSSEHLPPTMAPPDPPCAPPSGS